MRILVNISILARRFNRPALLAPRVCLFELQRDPGPPRSTVGLLHQACSCWRGCGACMQAWANPWWAPLICATSTRICAHVDLKLTRICAKFDWELTRIRALVRFAPRRCGCRPGPALPTPHWRQVTSRHARRSHLATHDGLASPRTMVSPRRSSRGFLMQLSFISFLGRNSLASLQPDLMRRVGAL